MSIRAGGLDRRIQFLMPNEVKQSRGVFKTTFVPYQKSWAKKLSTSAAQKVLGSELISEHNIVWSVRYREDVTSKFRIKLLSTGRQYLIEAIYEGPGRNEELFIVTTIEEPERGAA